MDAVSAVGLTLSTVGTALAGFSQVLPPAHQIAAAPADPGSTALVRRQAAHAVTLALVIGGGASLLARSPWPIVGAGAVSVWMWHQLDSAAQLDAARLT